MGKSNSKLNPVYKKLIQKLNLSNPKTAVLGSPGPYAVSNMIEKADCKFFDLKKKNWNINEDWDLKEKFDLILCNRCPYFAKNPETFIEKCYNQLNPKGNILIDWGYGDHWRFSNYKIGWVKNKEHEYCYDDTNFLWSGVWDDSFLKNSDYLKFCKWVKRLGYPNVKKAIFEETPKVMNVSYIKQYFDIEIELLALWPDKPQLYIFITGAKKS
jgi:SAM-dependent methyltransferase